jgi:hypothetical protein
MKASNIASEQARSDPKRQTRVASLGAAVLSCALFGLVGFDVIAAKANAGRAARNATQSAIQSTLQSVRDQVRSETQRRQAKTVHRGQRGPQACAWHDFWSPEYTAQTANPRTKYRGTAQQCR